MFFVVMFLYCLYLSSYLQKVIFPIFLSFCQSGKCWLFFFLPTLKNHKETKDTPIDKPSS